MGGVPADQVHLYHPMYDTVEGALLYVGEKDLLGTAVVVGRPVVVGLKVDVGADVGVDTGRLVQPALINGL